MFLIWIAYFSFFLLVWTFFELHIITLLLPDLDMGQTVIYVSYFKYICTFTLSIFFIIAKTLISFPWWLRRYQHSEHNNQTFFFFFFLQRWLALISVMEYSKITDHSSRAISEWEKLFEKIFPGCQKTFLACMFCFYNSGHMMFSREFTFCLLISHACICKVNARA